MQKNPSILTRGMVFLLMCLLIAGMAPMAMATDAPQVSITSVTETNGTVVVSGTTKNLGNRKVEIIVNEDLDLRYVANEDTNGNFVCEFELPYNGEYTVEASIRDYSDFNALRQTTPDENYFEMEGTHTWGATTLKHTDGLYYMIFSTWEGVFTNYTKGSELGYAVSTKLGGPYIYQGKALDAEGTNMTNKVMPDWGEGQLAVFHNPNLMYSEQDGRYYLYFMSKPISGTQKIGVAYADTPAGPWTVSEAPVINTRAGKIDSSYVCNPTVMELKDENGQYSYYAVYRANGETLRASAYATAPSPLGPFTQSEELIMVNPDAEYSVEDCYVWRHNGLYYSLAKDMSRGGLTGYTGGSSNALYVSEDGVDWHLSENALGYPATVPWESGEKKAAQLERAQLYLEDGIPFMIFNATTVDGSDAWADNHTCNVQIPLLGVPMAQDTYALEITDGQDKTVDKTALKSLLAIAEQADKKYYSEEGWWSLYTAKRASEIIADRASVEQADVDFVATELEAKLAQRIDPWDQPVNIVQGKPVVASHVYSNNTVGTFPGENAVDGNPSSRWATPNDTTVDVTLEIDLQGKYSPESFKITKFDDRIKGYTLQYLDGAEWKELYSTSTSEMSGVFSKNVVTEKLKLVITDYTSAPTLCELEVWGQYVSENIALNKTVTASSYYSSTKYGNYPAENAVDGDMTTRWSAKSGATGLSTFEIDLGGSYYIDTFEINQYKSATDSSSAARIETYVWEYYNGTEWKKCFEGTGTSSTWDLTGNFSGKEIAQKLKLSMNTSAKEPSIFEIKVYGALAGSNVALKKPIKVSGFDYGGNYTADKAVDGSTTTRCATTSAASGTITYEIDLQGRYALDSFRLVEFENRITSYSWEYYDGGKWVTCYNGTNAGAEKISSNMFVKSGDFTGAEVADKVRLNLTAYNPAPTIWEIEVYGSVVRSESVTLEKESLELYSGESAKLTATVKPDNTINKKVFWTSSDESVATVDKNGVITAVGAGEATITVTTKDMGHTDSCVVNVTASAAAVDGQFYSTLEKAMAAVGEGDTVQLLSDVTVNYITIDPEVTLDLNGKTLTADYVIGFNGSVICGEGRLKVARDKVALDQTNGGALPVYDGEGYIFIEVGFENRTAMVGEKTYAFSPLFEVKAHEALLEGYAVSGIRVVVRLNWTKAGNYEATQDFTYLDKMVDTVIESYDGANYDKMFVAEFAGSEAGEATNVTVSAAIISDTGVEIASAVTEFTAGN